MIHTFRWNFPLPRTHTGILQGNGTLGSMIWGGDNILNITLNRADFWDHRGGLPWREDMNYRKIRHLLETGDDQGLFAMFEPSDRAPGQPRRPSILPLGRLEVVLPEGDTLKSGFLQVRSGEVSIEVETAQGGEYYLLLNLFMEQPLLNLRFPHHIRPKAIRRVSAWEYVGEYLEKISMDAPEMFDERSITGWIQKRPADPPLCLAYHVTGSDLWATVLYGDSPDEAKSAAKNIIDTATREGIEKLRSDNDNWWYNFWSKAPRIDVPNERLGFLYHYGMYKFAGLTNPDGVAATLQGPWVEEYQMPPWSSDYHFNINVQMCYWPAFRGNLSSHLLPLFKMIESWTDILRENARLFIGIDDGLILPHAVDDRCTGMGGFWTGAIDHGCTAWVGEMMYRYYRYTGDVEFLRKTAYPFMTGAMRVYEEMLEQTGDRFSLPISVSPEYKGASPDAWGRNASFQLACIHFLCESLLEASAVLGKEPKHLWKKIRTGLPKASIFEFMDKKNAIIREIALWDGQRLEESHRHHSHLAALYPFDILDSEDPEWKAIIEESLATWISEGMGQWSGWCVPWASILQGRMGNSDAGELLLEIWERVFTNEGHGTLHDPNFSGLTLIGSGPTKLKTNGEKQDGDGAQVSSPPKEPEPIREIMQIEAGMSATAAILEMLVFTRRGINYIFSAVPTRWKNASFVNIRTEGAFVISASLKDGYVAGVSIRSEVGGIFRLRNPWSGSASLIRSGMRQERELVSGEIIAIPTSPGETAELLPDFAA